METNHNLPDRRMKWPLVARKVFFAAMAALMMFSLAKVYPGYLVVALLAVILWIMSGWKN